MGLWNELDRQCLNAKKLQTNEDLDSDIVLLLEFELLSTLSFLVSNASNASFSSRI